MFRKEFKIKDAAEEISKKLNLPKQEVLEALELTYKAIKEHIDQKIVSGDKDLRVHLSDFGYFYFRKKHGDEI